MTEVERFEFPVTGQAVRTVIVDGVPWFVAADVTAILGYVNGRDAVAKHVDADDRNTVAIRDGIRGNPNATAVTESGLYALIFGSRLESARAFKRWVTSDVLPAIRRTGGYSLTEHALPQSFAEALELAARQAREIEAKDKALAEAAPKADAWDVLASAKGDYSVREAANILNRDPAINTGQNRLYKTLRAMGLVDRNDVPYATHASHVCLRPTNFFNAHRGREESNEQLRVTVDGLRYLRKRLGSPALPGLDESPLATVTSK